MEELSPPVRIARAFALAMLAVLCLTALSRQIPLPLRLEALDAVGIGATRTAQQGILLAIALATVGLLGWAIRRVPARPMPATLAVVLLTLVTLCAAASAWLAPLSREQAFDIGDNFHYYLGAKYARELRYDKHYECVGAALQELGRRLPKRYRDLRTNEIEQLAPALEAGAAATCRAAFSEQRWKKFQRDVRSFRNWQTFDWLTRRFSDHGYNGTPAWTALAGSVTNAVPLTTFGQAALGLVNFVLLSAAFTLVVYAFGWELGLLTAILFWVQYADRYFLGGALLRYLPISLLLVGCALLKLDRARSAGLCVGCAAALLIFPGLFLVAAGLFVAIAVLRARRERRPLDEQARRAFDVLWSGALACAVCLIIGVAYAGGPSVIEQFLDKMSLNAGRIADGRIGLRLVLGNAPLRWAVALGLLGALAYAHRRASALTFIVLLGFALFFTWFPTVRYYYMGWVALPLALHAAPHGHTARLVIAALAALSAACFALGPHASEAFIHNTLLSTGILALLVALAVPSVASSLSEPSPEHGPG